MSAPALRILSLGAGVQSTALALMAAEGTLPGLDAAIFADTGGEPDAVYLNLGQVEWKLGGAGIKTFRVSASGDVANSQLDVQYSRPRHPLLELGMSRRDCERYLAARDWETAKSACTWCPFHGNRHWREMRDERPWEWRTAVAVDRALRHGAAGSVPLAGEAFLHASRVPLDEAPIDRVTRGEWRGRQGDLLDVIADEEEGEPDGCSPYGCRSGSEAT